MSQFNPVMVPPKRGLSTGAKVGIGCAVAAFVILAITGIVIYLIINQFLRWPKQFVEKGYVEVSGQVIEVTEPVTQDTVYVGQSVIIRGPVSANIALGCQAAEIHGVVEGDVDFYGQALVIGKAAVIKGDLRATGQVLTIEGRVEGELEATVQVLDDRSKKTDLPPKTDGADGPSPNGGGTPEAGGDG